MFIFSTIDIEKNRRNSVSSVGLHVLSHIRSAGLADDIHIPSEEKRAHLFFERLQQSIESVSPNAYELTDRTALCWATTR